MEALTFLERPCDAGEIPSVMGWAEAQRRILRASDPSVVGESTVWVGSSIRVNQLPCGLDAYLWIEPVESKAVRVFDEME